MTCRICDEILNLSDQSHCSDKCLDIGLNARARITEQTILYKKIKEVRMKDCPDCNEQIEGDRPNAKRCRPCAKARNLAQIKLHTKERRTGKRQPCRSCGGELGDDTPKYERYCSPKCLELSKVPTTDPTPNKSVQKEIDPKWLRRGSVDNLRTSYTSMNL